MGQTEPELLRLLGNRISCPKCHAGLLPTAQQCRFCGTQLHAPKATAPAPRPDMFQGVAYGDPVAQGSMRPLGGGRVGHVKGKVLHSWRQAIEDSLRTSYGQDIANWEPIEAAVSVEAVFTVPPRSATPKKFPTWAKTRPDLDKFARALGDALSPKAPSQKTGGSLNMVTSGPYSGHAHFRLLSEDSRIVSWRVAKTYPAPIHTDIGALRQPGVRMLINVLPERPEQLPMPAPDPEQHAA